MKTPSGHTLTVVAETGGRFTDFSPYVPAINDRGEVAFQAALSSGATAIYRAEGGSLRASIETGGDVELVRSHADIDSMGNMSVYVDLASGHGAVLYADGRQLYVVADTNGPLTHIRPAGPTMNDEGKVGFRAEFRDGHSGIFVGDVEGYRCVADTRDRFATFYGLPVVLPDGSALFRADLRGGGQGIYRSSGRAIQALVDTDGAMGALALFPSADLDGNVGFVGMLKQGGGGVFLAAGERIIGLADTTDGYASFRGALIGGGFCTFFAAPRGGELGIFSGRDPDRDRLFCLGDPLFGSPVVDFAANPVSLNRHGQLAIRVRLADDRQLIVKAEPG